MPRVNMSARWRARYYADLCTIYEKAGKYAEAKRACDFALVGTTDSSQAIELKQRIAGLEIGIERNSAGAQAQRKQEEFAGFLKSIEGAVFQFGPDSLGWVHRITVENGMLRISGIYKDGGREDSGSLKPTGFVTDTCGTNIWGAPKVNCSNNISLSPDGKTLTLRTEYPVGKITHTVLRRVN